MESKIKDKIALNLKNPVGGFFGWLVTKAFLRFNVFVGLSAASKYVVAGSGQIHGVDVSDKMVDLAHKRLKNEIRSEKVCIQKGNVLDLPYGNDTFNRVFHCNCYYFWTDIKVGCEELFRVMKPQSYMVTTINLESVKIALDKGFLKYGKPDHISYMKILEEVGFRDVNIQTMEDHGKQYQAMFAYVAEK